MTKEEACRTLYEHLIWNVGWHYTGGRLQAVGMGEKDGQPVLIAYLTTEGPPIPKCYTLPDTWEGFPVVVREGGPLTLCGA